MVLWVFGYGSLIWNPGFDFDEKLIGYIKDYKRVFDLGMFPVHLSTLETMGMLLRKFPFLQGALIIEARLNILQELARWRIPPEQYA